MQAAEHWRMSALQKGFSALQHAAHLKRTGQQILANLLSGRVRAAWNAWTDMVQVSSSIKPLCNFHKRVMSTELLGNMSPRPAYHMHEQD